MMTALEFIKQRVRMCNTYDDFCSGCPMKRPDERCGIFVEEHPEEAVSVVEQWAEKHPLKTRQSEFLKIFPNASIADGGYIDIDPCEIDQTLHCQRWTDEACSECKHKYWLSEVSEDDS